MRGFSRLSVAVPVCRVADFKGNAQAMIELWRQADAAGSSVVLFPELGLSGYTARDLFLDQHLLIACEDAVVELVESSKHLGAMAIIGMPLRSLTAFTTWRWPFRAVKFRAVPKSYLPNYREFEETRWFRPGTDVADGLRPSLGVIVFPSAVISCSRLMRSSLLLWRFVKISGFIYRRAVI